MIDESARIIFFVPEFPALASGVLHAQVLSMAGFLQAQGFTCMFTGCESSPEKALHAQSMIHEKYGISADVQAVYSDKFGYISRLATSLSLFIKAKASIHAFRPTHVYSRDLTAATFARRLAIQSNAKMIFDIRGALAEEVSLKSGKKGIAYYYILRREKQAIRKAQGLSCVSKKLDDYISTISGKRCTTIIPCCFDEKKFRFDNGSRKHIRQEFGIKTHEKVICYSGGLSKWQRVGDVMKLFSDIAIENPDYRFLFLTNDIKQIRLMIDEHSLLSEKSFVVSCAHEDVYKYLSASDAGVIMRHNILVNNVACPIKIGEYLGCGLPIIMTGGIGDLSEMIAVEDFGLVLDETRPLPLQVISFMNKVNQNPLREIIADFAISRLSFGANIKNFLMLYS